MPQFHDFELIKSDGETERFSLEKLRLSLERTGASEELINEVLKSVLDADLSNLTSGKIHSLAFRKLRSKAPASAGRYKLKRAIFELGPSGYPFERFIGELFAHQGYQTEVGITLPGRCIQHEVDVVAKRGSTLRLMECKFHRDPTRKSNVQTPLYIHSRFEDLKAAWPDPSAKVESWLITNTRFTKDAWDYGACVGMKLVDWSMPRGGALKDRIDGSGLHPITCLSSLNRMDKKRILDEGIVMCQDLTSAHLLEARVPSGKHKRVLAECAEIVTVR